MKGENDMLWLMFLLGTLAGVIVTTTIAIIVGKILDEADEKKDEA